MGFGSVRMKVVLAAIAAILIALHVVLWVVISENGPRILKESLSHHLGLVVDADHVKFSLLSQGVKIINLRLSDPAGDSRDAKPFFTAKKVLIHLNLLALLKRRISLRKVLVVSPALNIARRPNGQWSLPLSKNQQHIASESVQNPPGAPAPAQAPEGKTGHRGPRNKPFFAIAIHKIELRKGEILLGDETITPMFWVRLKNIQGKGEFTRRAILQLTLKGQVECRVPANFYVHGKWTKQQGRWNADIAMGLDGLDITLLAPYYQPHAPATITGGSLSLRSKAHCAGDNLEESLQSISLRNIKIQSWKENFLDGNTLGISNREFAQYIERNSSQLEMDFSISGPLEEITSMGVRQALQRIGISAMEQWIHKPGKGGLTE